MLKAHHDHRRDAQGELISKADDDWPEQLIVKVKSYLYGSLIDQQMDNLFGMSNTPNSVWERGGMYNNVNKSGHLTHDLAALTRDIVKYWDELEEPIRKRIKEKFDVDTSSVPIRISLSGSAIDC